jgi:hypothetical protein
MVLEHSVPDQCKDCGANKAANGRATCRQCYSAQRSAQRAATRRVRWVDPEGYVWIYRPGHIQAYKSGICIEHRMVMSDFLGRKLLPSENVHHKDGNRQNNAIENLELWRKAQPAGQRVSDLRAEAQDHC